MEHSGALLLSDSLPLRPNCIFLYEKRGCFARLRRRNGEGKEGLEEGKARDISVLGGSSDLEVKMERVREKPHKSSRYLINSYENLNSW